MDALIGWDFLRSSGAVIDAATPTLRVGPATLRIATELDDINDHAVSANISIRFCLTREHVLAEEVLLKKYNYIANSNNNHGCRSLTSMEYG